MMDLTTAPSPATAPAAAPSSQDWRKLVASYCKPSTKRASIQILNTIGAYLAVWVAMFFALKVSWWLVVPLMVLAGGLLIRVFIIFHDCTHGSFLKNKTANDVVGFISGLLTFTPYQHWRWEHTIHHASSGDLDRRGIGDIWTMTVEEYLAASRGRRLLYRISRDPVVMFVIAPVLLLVAYQRIPSSTAGPRQRRSVWIMNLAVVAMACLLAWVMGWKNYLIIQTVVAMIGGGAGVWLFYVQHQFEDVVWERRDEWNFATAALEGSSFYKLPLILQWFSGNIGFHHIHHLSPKIPNYHLQKCHESHEMFSSIPPLTWRTSLKTVRLKLWDEKNRRLIGYRELRELRSMGATA